MSVTYGFYNSLNHDRKYNAVQMSKIFDGIIKDGIFMSIGECFAVTAGSGMEVIVGSGKAWFNHTWTENDADLPVSVFQSEVVLNRIDALVLEVDATDSTRANSIKFIKGTPSSNPVIPTLKNTTTVHQHLLVTVTVPAGATSILQSMITNYIGTTTTPFVSGILETVSLDTLLGQWQAMLDEFVVVESSDFTTWFDQMKAQLTTDAAGNLQTQIDAIKKTYLTATKSIYVTTTGSDISGVGSSSNPYRTWTKAVSMIPKNANGYDITINVAGGIYEENVIIQGVHGGSVYIVLAGDVKINKFEVEESTYVYISSASVVTLSITNTSAIPFRALRASAVQMYNVNMTIETSKSYAGLYVGNMATFTNVNIITVNGSNYGAQISISARVSLGTFAGSNNNVGVRASEGSILSYTTRTIVATNDDMITGGSIITNDLEKKSTIGTLANLLTAVKTNIVDAINNVIGTLLPPSVSVSTVLTKPTVPVYGQTYRYYFVACRYANHYTISGLSVTVIGLGGITGVSVVAQYTNGFLVLDTLEVGNGYPIQITATLTKS